MTAISEFIGRMAQLNRWLPTNEQDEAEEMRVNASCELVDMIMALEASREFAGRPRPQNKELLKLINKALPRRLE